MKTGSDPKTTDLMTLSKLHKPSNRAHKSSVTQDESVKDISGWVNYSLISLAGDVSGQKENDFDPVKVSQVSYPNNSSMKRAVNKPSETDRFFCNNCKFFKCLSAFLKCN